MDELLRILRVNARESIEDLARMTQLSTDEVESRIREYEKQGIIRGYQTILDEDRIGQERVTAVIEVKVTPERRDGFNQIAHRIGAFQEVQSLYLVSGTFDLLLFVEGRNLHEIAAFVSEKLAPLEGVTSTCSHFMLKTYKHRGVEMESHDEYERLKITP